MGLFGKSKKDKGESNAKAKKRVQDRFMEHALGAKFVNAKSSEVLEYEFTQAFSEHNIKVTGGRTERLALGRGKFDKPYQQAKEVTRKYAGYISGTDDPSDAVLAEMIVEFEKLETLAQGWLQSDEAKWSNKDESKKDKVTQLKEIEARGMLEGARTALFQLRNRDRLEDPANQKLFALLETARDKLEDPTTATAKAREECRSLDAEVLAALCGGEKPSNGTSDVKLIKGADGNVAYAFKSMEGESEMMGTPKGFATAREVMMSKLSETLNEKYQIGLGWPKVTMANVGKKPGALIDGVKGMRDNNGEFERDDIPAEALQKILLGNLAGGQFDIKWEDVRLERQGDTLAPTCMDGGASMPDTTTATTFLVALSDGLPGATMLDNGRSDTVAENRVCAGAKEKMSPALVKQFLAIDTVALKKELDTEAKRLETDHQLGVKALGLDSGVQTSITSIEGIQQILRDSGGDITLVDFMKQYHSRVIQKKFVEPNVRAWKQAQLDEFARVRQAHPGLFHPADKYADVSELYREVLHPEMRQKLKEFADLAKPRSIVDVMKKFGRPAPVTTFMGTLNDVKRAIQTINDGLKGYDQLESKYPGIIKPRTSFASPEEAYLEVLDTPNVTALSNLAEICKALTKAEGRPVTMAQLLQRHGCKVPTSNFKEVHNTVKAGEAKLKEARAKS
jgi:hypothetical protein